MFAKLIRGVHSMEFEEKILHGGSLLTAIGIFFPWFEGKRFCADMFCNGFRFFTGYIGFTVFVLQIALLAITFSPMIDGPILVRKSSRNFVRLMLSSASVLLLLASLSVLVKLFSEDSGATIRFGMYLSLIGAVISLLYSFLKYQEQLRKQVQELFHHPEDAGKETLVSKSEEEQTPPPPPPVPEPPPPEEHSNLFS